MTFQEENKEFQDMFTDCATDLGVKDVDNFYLAWKDTMQGCLIVPLMTSMLITITMCKDNSKEV